jgi:hypothetical protein
LRRPTPALVLSVIALVLALTGSAIAGGYIITSTKQIKPSVRKALRGHRGPAGYDGSDGAQGVPGVQGVPGPVGLASVVIAQGDTTLCGGTTQCSIGGVSATCPAGTKPFGGGVLTEALNGTFAGSINNTNGYLVGADNYGSGTSAQLSAFAYCSKDVASITFPNGTMTRSKLSDLASARYAARR